MSLLDKNELKEKTKEELIDEVMFQQTKSFALCESMDLALWEYDIKSRKLEHQRKFGGKWSDSNMDIPDYRNTMLGWGIIHPDDIDVFNQYCDDMDNGADELRYEIRSLTDSGAYSWIRYIGKTVRDQNSGIDKVVGVTINISELKKEKTSLVEKASRDPLTGLLNKVATKNAIIESLKDLSYEMMHCLAIIDIDDFKFINDTFGHQSGDVVLAQFSQQLREFFPNDITGRVGGDEFFIFKKNLKTMTEVENVGIMICEAAKSVHLKNSQSVCVSVGISVYKLHGLNYDELYLCADNALYQTKKNGKDSYTVYDESMKHDRLTVHERKQSAETADTGEDKGVDQCVIDSVLNILSEKKSVKSHITGIFEYVAGCYGINRVFLCSCSAENNKISIPYFWSDCNKEDFRDIVCSEISLGRHVFEKSAMESTACVVADTDTQLTDACAAQKNIISKLGIKSFIKINIYMENQKFTFIEFDVCSQKCEFTQRMSTTVSAVSKIVGAYLSNTARLSDENTLYQSICSETLVNMCDGFYYVVDPMTYDIKYISENTRKKYSITSVSGKCYKLLCAADTPCKRCFASEGTKNYGLITGLYKSSETLIVKTKQFSLGYKGAKLCAVSAQEPYKYSTPSALMDSIDNDASIENFIIHADKILHDNPDEKFAVVYIRFASYSSLLNKFGRAYALEILRTFSRVRSYLKKGELYSHAGRGDFVMFLRYDTPCKFYERLSSIMLTINSVPESDYERSFYCLKKGVVFTDQDKGLSITDYIDRSYTQILATDNNIGIRDTYFYQLDISQLAHKCRELSENLSACIAANEFVIRYNEVRDVSNGDSLYYELKYFWEKNGNPQIAEADFMEFIDLSAQLQEISSMKLRLACRFIRSRFDKEKNIRVSVPISQKEACEPGFADTARQILKLYSISPEMIDFSLDECLMRQDMDKFITITQSIAFTGAKYSVYSVKLDNIPMNILSLIKFNIIKIDAQIINLGKEIIDHNPGFLPGVFTQLKMLRDITYQNQTLITLSSPEPFDSSVSEELKTIGSISCIFHQGWS
ncbi:MAG: diguanylate cyclase [Oscillospiraceae bacterium]|nr:diguanylate cyclase [Oscillospiraceae bacterium]